MKYLLITLITLLFTSCSEDVITPGCDCDVVTYDANGRVLDRQHSPGHCEPAIIFYNNNGKSLIECK